MTTETLTLLAGAALVVAVVALLLALWLVARTRSLARLGAFRPEMPADLQSAVERESARLDEVARLLEDVRTRLPAVERQGMMAVQRIGVVRFNPFADTGGQQSFAVAMVDGRGSGIVISSLHSRQQTRLYLKQLSEGRSETPLSEEEIQALGRAGVPGQGSSIGASRRVTQAVTRPP